MGSTFKVETLYNKDLIIQDVVMTDPIGNFVQRVSREVIEHKEEGVRQALIALGWAPPEEVAELKEDQRWLQCLNAEEVDNWEGYDYAWELMSDEP